MSFRGRLTLFLLLIVALPMIVIAVLASRTADDAASGKADARLFAGLETATVLYEDAARRPQEAAEDMGSDPALADAVRSGDEAAAQQAAAGSGGARTTSRRWCCAMPRARSLRRSARGRPSRQRCST